MAVFSLTSGLFCDIINLILSIGKVSLKRGEPTADFVDKSNKKRVL